MERLILSEDEIVRVCQRLGKEIDASIAKEEKAAVVLGVMNGALPFLYELVKHIQHPILLDTIKVKSYDGTQSTGEVLVEKLPDYDLEGRDVILVEDIIDTGVTMHFLKEYIQRNFRPRSLRVCILIKRNNLRMKFDEKADFTGLETDEQKYIVGFGFDYRGLFRNVPYIFVPSIKDIKSWEPFFATEKDEE